MKNQIFTLILLLMTVLRATGATEHLRIMTYNVPRNNEYIGTTGVNVWENRIKELADVINEVHPDVLGMQEPTNSDLWSFLKLLPGYSMLGIGRDDGIEKGQYTLILYRTDKYVVEHDGYYFLSKTPDVLGSKDWGSECRRLATWAIFRNKETRSCFFYTNTHLDHISDSARTNQMRVLKEHMLETVNKYGTYPMMITGDFNVATTSSGAYVNATQLHIPMNDAWIVAQAKEGLTYSFPSYESSSKRKIDYIILSKDIKVSKAYLGNSVRPSGTIISDHNPHWADITWDTKKAEDDDRLMCEAQAAIDSTLVFKMGKQPLITNADENSADCQLKYDTKETGANLKNLIDGSTFNYFRSSWSGANPYNPHYFQVDLRKEYQYVHFNYARSDASDSSTVIGNCWVDMMVTGSNDEQNWEYVTEYCDIPSTSGLRTFPTIAMKKPYRYLRFNTMRTPDMKIRHSFPQYVIGEFQLYEDIIDAEKSQSCFSEEIKNATEVLRTVLAEARTLQQSGNLTDEVMNDLRQKLLLLRQIKIDKRPLLDLISESSALLDKFPVGSKYGQTSQEAHDALMAFKTEYESTVEGMDSRALVDTAYQKLYDAKEKFLASRRSFEENKWYYIQCQHLLKTAKQALYGQLLYATGNGSGVMLKNDYFTKSRNLIQCKQNPYAMWRVVKIDGTDDYALQNRATGLYLGGLNYEGDNFVVSAAPVALTIDMQGEEDFHISVKGTVDQYVTALTSRGVGASGGGYHSQASWTFTPVDDEAIGTIQIPLTNHTINIMTLPFAFENTHPQNARIKTYTLVDMPKAGTFYLRRKDKIAAGEPFFVMTGSADSLDANAKENIFMEVAPPKEVSLQTSVVNGMYGILDNITLSKSAYYVTNNALKMGKVALDANTGYIIRMEVTQTDKRYNLEFSMSEGVKTALLLGDLNDDGNINIGDLTHLISLVMDGYQEDTPLFKTSDINADEVLNVGDITSLVKIIMTEN